MFSYKSPVTIFKILSSTLKRSEKSMSAYNEAWGKKGNEIKRYPKLPKLMYILTCS